MKSSPSILVALLLLLCIALVAQSVLTNDAIVKMTKAGLSEDIIVSTVGSQPAKFSTSADDLIALKKAGVSDKVIGAMMTKGSATAAPTPAPVAADNGRARRRRDRRLSHESRRLGRSAGRNRQLQNRRRAEEHRHGGNRQGRCERSPQRTAQSQSAQDPVWSS